MQEHLTLDVRKPDSAFSGKRLSTMRRGEKGNREMVVSITTDGEPYELVGKTVKFSGSSGSGGYVSCDVEVVSASGGTVKHIMPKEMLSEIGSVGGYYEIYQGDDFLDTTESFAFRVAASNDVSGKQAGEYIPLIELWKVDEQTRKSAEQARAAEEEKRSAAEKDRASAEAKREKSFMESKQAADEAAAAANKAAADAAALLPLGLYVDDDGDICQKEGD